MDISALSNSQLTRELKNHGLNSGPIVPTTRRIYEKKLMRILAGENKSTGNIKRQETIKCQNQPEPLVLQEKSNVQVTASKQKKSIADYMKKKTNVDSKNATTKFDTKTESDHKKADSRSKEGKNKQSTHHKHKSEKYITHTGIGNNSILSHQNEQSYQTLVDASINVQGQSIIESYEPLDETNMPDERLYSTVIGTEFTQHYTPSVVKSNPVKDVDVAMSPATHKSMQQYKMADMIQSPLLIQRPMRFDPSSIKPRKPIGSYLRSIEEKERREEREAKLAKMENQKLTKKNSNLSWLSKTKVAVILLLLAILVWVIFSMEDNPSANLLQ